MAPRPVAASLAVGSVAWACTVAEGSTFFTNGKVTQTVMRGFRISAYVTKSQAHLTPRGWYESLAV